jgi:hypothetical protein
MVEVLVAVVVLLAAAVVFAKIRAKRRRNYNPGDIYPHW